MDLAHQARELLFKAGALARVDPALGYLKLGQVPPELRALKKQVFQGIPKQDPAIRNLRKSVMPKIQRFDPNIQALKRSVLKSIKISGYDPDVDYYSELPFLYGPGEGNAANNPEFDFSAPTGARQGLYPVNQQKSNASDIWDRFLAQAKATEVPATTPSPSNP